MTVRSIELASEVASAAVSHFSAAGLKEDELAITVHCPAGTGGETLSVDFRGEEKIYPASVVKLFYLAAAYKWLADGRLKKTDELKRAIKDMIVESSNDATHYVLDLLTGTTSGPELPDKEMEEWLKKRNAINDYFAGQGYKNINVNQKPWGDGPFGRERIGLGPNYEKRNMLTTNAVARLLSEMAAKKCVSETASAEMLALMERDYTVNSSDADDQATGFFARGLPEGSRLFSKAGWTSTARHDAAYIELPDGKSIVLVAFTMNHAKEYGLLPFVAQEVIKRLSA